MNIKQHVAMLHEECRRKAKKGEPLTINESRFLVQALFRQQNALEVLRFQLGCAVNDLREAGLLKEKENLFWDKSVTLTKEQE